MKRSSPVMSYDSSLYSARMEARDQQPTEITTSTAHDELLIEARECRRRPGRQHQAHEQHEERNDYAECADVRGAWDPARHKALV